ncbi:down syndrome cell adhesion molecule-like protein Dscam2 [Caerostris extrusa]|uniref:Down syndrome cell adhesion molecule-like protein Dscam2 n=1 Tax=Caerostris extrusa TaxID=172846 RepID=A0AAV4W294_CAEEX|nr:down syndrome cell adhesion molecule-like protein Dscam2 [Caerostris extrusa]
MRKSDDVPEFQETFEEQTIQPGPSLSLKCGIWKPLPQIVWRLDDAPIPEKPPNTCVANNGVGEVSHESRVNVLGPPVVVRRARNVTVVAGDVLVLRCPVAGISLGKYSLGEKYAFI